MLTERLLYSERALLLSRLFEAPDLIAVAIVLIQIFELHVRTKFVLSSPILHFIIKSRGPGPDWSTSMSLLMP